jgi:hypothetical protein
VTLVQYLRTRDRRVLVLLALFGFQALSLTRDWWDYKREVFQTAACAAGLLLLLMLTLRHPALAPGAPAPPRAVPPPEARRPADGV